MSGQFILVPKNGESIIKGNPFSVIVTVSDDENIGDNTEFNVNNLISVKLLKILPKVKGVDGFSQEIVFFSDKNSSEYKISFFTNIASNLKMDVEYKAADNPDLKPENYVLGTSPSYLYDPNPVDFSGTIPEKKHPFLLASVNPTIKDGYYKVVIHADKLMGYDTSNDAYVGSITIDYSHLVQNQKSKLFTREFDTVVP